jgi:CRP/FNR family transcriptional regulator, nitrogen oxide reductase regulator
MMSARSSDFGKIRPGDHCIVVYDDTAELAAFAGLFITTGLASGERCLYVVDDTDHDEATEALAAGGVDVKSQIDRGALLLMNAHEFYGVPPSEVARMSELHLERLAEAGPRGFTGLRIAADMTGVHKMGIRDDPIVGFESLLDQTAGSGPLTLASMYRRERFSPALLKRLVHSRAKVIAGDHVFLSLTTLFQTLASTDLQGLLRSADERRVPKGGFYFHQGDDAKEVYVLTSGAVKFVRSGANGENAILHIVAPPELFGHVGALGGTHQLASAQALVDSRALVWEIPTILQALMSHPAVSLSAIRLLVDSIGEWVDRVQDLSISRVDRRLARLLLRLAQRMGYRRARGVTVEFSLSGQDLAELTSTTPYTVSRLLAKWRRLDIVDVQRDRIFVLDEPRLAVIAGYT